MLLKADFHIHTRDDPHDFIRHTSEELLEEAARQGFPPERERLAGDARLALEQGGGGGAAREVG